MPEALRWLLMAAGRWPAKKQKVEKVHPWRQRRSCRGELVQWDTSEHDWLDGRGPKLYLIAMIDDARMVKISSEHKRTVRERL